MSELKELAKMYNKIEKILPEVAEEKAREPLLRKQVRIQLRQIPLTEELYLNGGYDY